MAVDTSLEDAQFATDFLRRFAALLSSVHLAQSVSVINIKVKC